MMSSSKHRLLNRVILLGSISAMTYITYQFAENSGMTVMGCRGVSLLAFFVTGFSANAVVSFRDNKRQKKLSEINSSTPV